jgi:flagellin-specific chaperone FliS
MLGDFPSPQMDIHVFHHNENIERSISKLNKKVNILMATIQDLTAAVKRNTDIDDSVLAMVTGIVQQLKDAQASNDPAAMQSLIDQLDANTKKMADAVTANTPAEEPPVVPTPTV